MTTGILPEEPSDASVRAGRRQPPGNVNGPIRGADS